jgi:SAM-dependent methyltransferase
MNGAADNPRWGNDGRERKAAVMRQILAHFAGSDLRDARWLDVGCGSGGIAAALAAEVAQVTGLDPEPWPQWPELMQRHANLRLLQGSYDAHPLEAGSFDVVVCNQVYEHVPDPVQLIAFIHQVLRPGGVVYFAGPNLLFPVEPHCLWPFVHWLPRRFAIRLMRSFGSQHPLDAYSANYWTLRRWLAGFEVVNALPYLMGHPADFGRQGLLWKSVGAIPSGMIRTLSFLSPGFVFVLKKPEG